MSNQRQSMFFVAILLISATVLSGGEFLFKLPRAAAFQNPVQLETIIDTTTLFPSCVSYAWIAAGDITADGIPDIAITKGAEGCMSGAAVLQYQNGSWDSGTLLAGPGDHNAWYDVVAPIRNDGQNWLMYTQSRIGNTGTWLKAHRYDGTTLVDTTQVASWSGWPGWIASNVADLNEDLKLEIWFVELLGSSNVLFRHEWDPNTSSFLGDVIASVAGGEPVRRPEAGDFLGDGSSSLVWMSSYQVHLVTYTPGSGTHDYTNSSLYTSSDPLLAISSGEFDGQIGTDTVFTSISPSGTTSNIYLISGGSFTVTQIGNEIEGGIEALANCRPGWEWYWRDLRSQPSRSRVCL